MKQLHLKLLAPVFSLFFVLTSLASLARGHAFPVRSEPRVGATISSPPSQLRIWFDEKLKAGLCTIAVYNAEKKQVKKTLARVDQSDETLLEVDLPLLPAGTYHVYWQAVSKDNDRTKGDFSFTIKGGAP